MASQLCHVAMALEVTSLGGPADTQLIIEDNLIEMGQQPQKVILKRISPMVGLGLCDDSGLFITVELELSTELVIL